MPDQTDRNKQIEPDVVTPGSVANLIDSRDAVILQHGGSVTRIGFDRLEQMPVDWFLEHEVAKLKDVDRTLTLLRDSVSGTYAAILGDQVLRYHVVSVEECLLDDVLDRLKRDEDFSLSLNTQYPLVSYVSGKAEESITVELPSMQRRFRSENYDVDINIYTPPMWFRLSSNKAGAMTTAAVAAVPERSLNRNDTKLYRLPLPNNWADGRICFGDVTLSVAGDGTRRPTLGERLQGAIDRMFLSSWNTDLSDHMAHVMSPSARSALSKLPAMPALDDSSLPEYMQSVLKVLTTPNGWQLLDYVALQSTPRKFTKCDKL